MLQTIALTARPTTPESNVPAYRVTPGSTVALKIDKSMADKKLSFKKHGNNLLVVDNGNTLVVLEDALNAQGEPQVSVSLQAEAGGEVLAYKDHQTVEYKDHLWDGQDLAKIDIDTSLSHLGASVAEQSTAGFLSSTSNVLLSAASAVAAGGAGGGSGGSAAPTSTTPTASTTPSTTTPSTTASTDTQTSALTQVFNITGNNQANRLVGNASANVLDGAGGDDILQGAGGDDTLIGGTGQDTAVYKGHAADYAISYDAAKLSSSCLHLRRHAHAGGHLWISAFAEMTRSYV
jgi:Ca2+-binding RTX toxin-like protein